MVVERKEKKGMPPDWGVGAGMEGDSTHGPFSLPARPARKEREIFPLPLLQDDLKPRPGLGRKTARRVLVEGHLRQEVNKTIWALNSMYGVPKGGATYINLQEELFGQGASQMHAIDHIVKTVRDVGKPPADLTGSGALRMLRAAEGYTDEPAVGSLCTFNLDRVSIPDPGWNPIPLDQLWGPGGRDFVDDFVNNQLLPPTEVGRRLKASGVSKPYSDPLLNVRAIYGSFLQRLHSASLVEYSLQKSDETIAIFFVTKKAGRQRMILDCRRANCHFKDPAYVSLCTGDTLARLQFGRGEVVHVGMADLKDAFYHLELPQELRRFFGLRPIEAKYLGVSEVDGIAVKPHQLLTPRLSVVPMGWSWALYLCQKMHERLVLQSGLSSSDRLQDRKRVDECARVHLQYVDNLVVLGSNREQVATDFHRAVDHLKSAGLQVHEVELGGEGAQVLGWFISSDGQLTPTQKRFWKVRLAIRGLVKRGRATSKQVEKLLGHCCFLALARREGLSVFGQSYAFVHRFRSSHDEVPLWPSVRKELEMFDGILPLIRRDLTAEWSERVYAVDASEWGMGCTYSSIPYASVKQLGGFCERWRFKDPETSRARAHVFLDPEDDFLKFSEDDAIDPTDPRGGPITDFEAVPFEAVDRQWVVNGRHQWHKASSMPVNEARAALYAVKHLLRSVGSFGCRHVILSDSMTSTCAFSRGRAQSYELRRVCQQFGALCLVSGAQITVRWIPSEWNPADMPSRGGWSASIPKKFGTLVGQQSDGSSPWDSVGRASSMGQAEQGAKIDSKNQEEEIAGASQTDWPGAQSCDRFGSGSQPNASTVEKGSTKSSSIQEGPSGSKNDNSAGGQCSERKQKSICAALGGSEASGGGKAGSVEDPECHRQQSVSTSRSHVPGWGRHQYGQLYDGSGDLLQSQSPITSLHEVPKMQTVATGVAEPMSCKKPTSRSMGSDSTACDPWDSGGADTSGSSHSPHVHTLFETIRSLGNEKHGYHSSYPKKLKRVQVLDSSASSSGGGTELKDEGVRRNVGTGSGVSSECGSRNPKVLQREEGTRSNLLTQHDRTSELLGSGRCRSEFRGSGSTSPLQVSSRRSITRLCQPASGPQQHSTERKMALCSKLPKISERGSIDSNLWIPTPKCSAKVSASRKRHWSHPCGPALKPQFSLHEEVFIEIFCGCGRLGKAVARECNLPVLLWDVNFGPQYDLLVPSNRRLIVGWLRSRRIKAGHLGVPCNSFTRARDNPPGPPPLRSNEHVLGLPGLSQKDQIKVDIGNCLMKFAVLVLHISLLLEVPMTLENPRTSRLWLCPQVQKLLRRRHVQVQHVEFCMFGTVWKKPTSFLGVWINLEPLMPFRCIGCKRGLCARSGRAHVPLAGLGQNGVWMTKLAEPYPVRLCSKLAQCFANFFAQQRATDFQKRL